MNSHWMRLPLLFAVSGLARVVCASEALVIGLVDVCGTNGTVCVQSTYSQALEMVGHVPLVFPCLASRNLIARQVERVDLVLFCGGEDIDPSRYGAEKSPKCGEVNRKRDAFEWMVLDECVRVRKPVFGICRGAQLLNCYFGGTLHQDIESEIERACQHRHKQGEKRDYIDHEIFIEQDSRLYSAIGRRRVSVKAWHHQCVFRLASGFRVSAVAADGTVEAIESDSYPAVGVQFHPEENVVRDKDCCLLEVFRKIGCFCGGSGK